MHADRDATVTSARNDILRLQVGSLPCHAITFFYYNDPTTFRPAAWPVPLGRGTRGDWHEEIDAGVLTASRVGMNGT